MTYLMCVFCDTANLFFFKDIKEACQGTPMPVLFSVGTPSATFLLFVSVWEAGNPHLFTNKIKRARNFIRWSDSFENGLTRLNYVNCYNYCTSWCYKSRLQSSILYDTKNMWAKLFTQIYLQLAPYKITNIALFWNSCISSLHQSPLSFLQKNQLFN